MHASRALLRSDLIGSGPKFRAALEEIRVATRATCVALASHNPPGGMWRALYLSIFSIAVSEVAGEPGTRHAQQTSSRRRRVCYHVGSIGELITFYSDKGGAGHRKIQRVITGRIRCRAPWSNFGGMVGAVCVVLLTLLLEGCARPSVHEPV